MPPRSERACERRRLRRRWATRSQVEAAYPQFVDFLRLKKKYDPEERLQSNWYRHYREMFSGDLDVSKDA